MLQKKQKGEVGRIYLTTAEWMASVVIYPPTFPRSAFEIISSSRNANHASAEILQQVLTRVERIENQLF